MFASTTEQTDLSPVFDPGPPIPSAVESDQAGVLTEISRDNYNIAIWRRELAVELHSEVKQLLINREPFEVASIISRHNGPRELDWALKDFGNLRLLTEDMAMLVELYCQLFERTEVRLRLTSLDRVMCPRFHTDNIVCRLVTTYIGSGTQWLPHDAVDRSKLGKGNNGLPDERSGIYQSAGDIQQLQTGDVALMKGARWGGNQQIGLVHRSPVPVPGETRLLLALDFIS